MKEKNPNYTAIFDHNSKQNLDYFSLHYWYILSVDNPTTISSIQDELIISIFILKYSRWFYKKKTL